MLRRGRLHDRRQVLWMTGSPTPATEETKMKLKIKVLGTGCAKCKKLYSEAEKAIAAAGVEAELEKVEKIDEIMAYSVMMTPALVIDGEVKASGRVPPVPEMVTWLVNAAARG
jgi:small redox-active disulfide protein 2